MATKMIKAGKTIASMSMTFFMKKNISCKDNQ